MERLSRPQVCVLMASYNGEKYISEQIESILNQKGVNPALVVRDDGSTDSTIDIIHKYEIENKIELITGKNLGPARNFYKLLEVSPGYDYYAWSDQDDIWDSDKLYIGIEKVKENSEGKPFLYYSASRTVDASGELKGVIGVSNPSITFAQALIQSKAQGATFVFNKELRDIALKYVPDFKKYNILHDAWLHRVCLAVGGNVYHDKNAHISYRIHESNVLAKKPTKSIIKRIRMAFEINSIHYCSDVAKELIKGYSIDMPHNNYVLARMMSNYRNSISDKLSLMFSKDIKVNSIKDNCRFKMNVLISRM
ncbi:MAG TPA: glycosyltransferase family 2 protein [Lachnospiraceae bacterium]|nr:glycosyltransferase family 2 protein [Lachnospiraceae bacterium]